MMSDRQSATEIEEQAVRWVWRIDCEGRTPALQAELDGWLAGDVRRRGALLQAEATWLLLDRGSQLQGGELEAAPRDLRWRGRARGVARCRVPADAARRALRHCGR